MAATVPSLDDVFTAILARLGADALIAEKAVPVIAQDDAEYDAKFERALAASSEGGGSGPGVCLTLWAADGQSSDGGDSTRLVLANKVVVAVTEHRRHNTTGKGARQWCGHVLRILGRADEAPNRGRPALRIPGSGPAYELGGLEHGLVIYFAHLEVRTAEDFGAPPPSP